MSSGIIRAFSTVGGWTLASRVLGFVRDKLFAQFIGAGDVSDAFFTAFRIPNLFRRFLAEGAFNSAFVPMFSKRTGDPEEAQGFAQNAFSGLMTLSLALILIIQIATPLFVILLAQGFVGTEKFDLAVNYTRITIFYILFMSLSALCSGILNSYQKYTLAAAAPVLLNVVFIIGFFLIWLFDIQDLGMFMSYVVLAGGVLQLSLLLWGVRKQGIHLRIKRPVWNGDMKQLLIIALPATLTAGVTQINLIVGSQIASGTDKAISWLYYADRVYQLPLGMIGVAVGVVLLPTLSKLVKSGDHVAANAQFNQAILFSMLLAIPSSFAISSLALPILRTVFEGGRFTYETSIVTAKALTVYGFGLPAFILVKILQPVFFAREDTKTPARHALINVAVHAAIALSLLPLIGFMAAPWAMTISSWIMVAGLWWSASHLDGAARLSRQTIRNLLIFTWMAFVMALGAWCVCTYFQDIFDDALWKWVFLAVVVGFSMIIYFAGVMWLSGIGPRQLKALVRR